MRRLIVGLVICACCALAARGQEKGEVLNLIQAVQGDTPLIEDLRTLTDEIGGRPTGSAANMRSVEWALERFRAAGVSARKEAFDMPALWLERSASSTVRGAVEFRARVAAMPFSIGTPVAGAEAPFIDAGRGTTEDFERLGEEAKGALVLIETDLLQDVPGLFKEYADAAEIERRAFAAEVMGVVYMGSRSRSVLYRHNASLSHFNRHLMLVMERDAATRAMRLLRAEQVLTLRARVDINSSGPYESFNVIGEIRGSLQPEEFVVVGAHLDSWGIGTGALDNGANVALVIDLARQMSRLGIKPKRTIRFALFNGEEQGMHGSLGYTLLHADELDRHVMASSYDIGSGRITGYFTNGRSELFEVLDAALQPVENVGPFEHSTEPIVGTDNFDFMLQGVANLVANQESANYGPNHHARTDTFEQVDLEQLRKNAAVAAAITYAFANVDVDWVRHDREAITELVGSTSLGEQLKMFNYYESWASGTRGRTD